MTPPVNFNLFVTIDFVAILAILSWILAMVLVHAKERRNRRKHLPHQENE